MSLPATIGGAPLCTDTPLLDTPPPAPPPPPPPPPSGRCRARCGATDAASANPRRPEVAAPCRVSCWFAVPGSNPRPTLHRRPHRVRLRAFPCRYRNSAASHITGSGSSLARYTDDVGHLVEDRVVMLGGSYGPPIRCRRRRTEIVWVLQHPVGALVSAASGAHTGGMTRRLDERSRPPNVPRRTMARRCPRRRRPRCGTANGTRNCWATVRATLKVESPVPPPVAQSASIFTMDQLLKPDHSQVVDAARR